MCHSSLVSPSELQHFLTGFERLKNVPNVQNQNEVCVGCITILCNRRLRHRLLINRLIKYNHGDIKSIIVSVAEGSHLHGPASLAIWDTANRNQEVYLTRNHQIDRNFHSRNRQITNCHDWNHPQHID